MFHAFRRGVPICFPASLASEAMVEAMESIKTAAIHADARAELANLLEKAAEELAVGAMFVHFSW